MKPLRYIIIYVLALFAVQSVVANSVKPTVASHLSADSIMIGDRVVLTIDVEKDMMQQVQFPYLNLKGDKQAESSIEVIKEFDVDTVSKEGRREHLRKRYELVIYDEGVYNFDKAHVLYADKNILDTLYADSDNRVVVGTFDIDTTQVRTVLGVKPQKNLEFRFEEISGYVAIGVALLLLLALVIWLLVRYLRKRGKRLSDLFKPAPPVPAHIVALGALEKLRGEKLWQNDKHKLYYSRLSDILRCYLAGRFGVEAMEMTTDEIVIALRHLNVDQKAKMDILSLLRDADLVKFAKALPEAEENEQAYNKALNFVESTKPVEQVVEKEDKPTKNRKGAK